MARLGGPLLWEEARTDLARLSVETDLRSAAEEYVNRWPNHPPDYFIDTPRYRKKMAYRAFGSGEGWACRLISELETVAHFTLHAQHLGLDRSASDPNKLRVNVVRWTEAIQKNFDGPCRWKLEVGDNRRLHAHVIADLHDGPPKLFRDGQVIKSCEGYYETLIGYLSKPPMTYTAENLALWWREKASSQLPRMSGTIKLPNRRRWRPSVSPGLVSASSLPPLYFADTTSPSPNSFSDKAHVL